MIRHEDWRKGDRCKRETDIETREGFEIFIAGEFYLFARKIKRMKTIIKSLRFIITAQTKLN